MHRATADDRLEAKVRAVNRANKYAHELYATLEPIFRPLVGQAIIKVNGGLLAKVEKLLPEFPHTVPLHVVYQAGSAYSWRIKTCEMGGKASTCCYHEESVYIVELDGTKLVGLYPPFEGRYDHTADEVRNKRAAYKQAKELADKARSALHPFGEWDS